MFTILLAIHVISAAVWLGGATYERFVVLYRAKKAMGTERELEMMHVFLEGDRILMPASVVLLLTGLAMTVAGHYGFFQLDWMGFKQFVMVAILLAFLAYMGPQTRKLKKQIEQNSSGSRHVTETTRRAFARTYVGFDLIHLGVAVNVILAVWKPM